MKPIYTYTNPVIYLKNWKKETGTSFRIMALASGFKTKTFFHKLFRGEKMYTFKRTKGIGAMLGLKGKELKYFRIMSFLHHSKAPAGLRKEVLDKFRSLKYRK